MKMKDFFGKESALTHNKRIFLRLTLIITKT